MSKTRAERLSSGLSAQILQAFETIKFARAYHKGALLFVEGQSPRGIFVLCSGRVRLSTSTTGGKRLVVKIAEAGDILGLNATVSGKPHQVSAESVEVCQVYFVRREDFVRFLKSYPDFCLKVAEEK